MKISPHTSSFYSSTQTTNNTVDNSTYQVDNLCIKFRNRILFTHKENHSPQQSKISTIFLNYKHPLYTIIKLKILSYPQHQHYYYY